MQMVITRVKLKPGTAEACAELFRKTNPDIVRNEPDWLRANMVVDRETDTLTVMARWRNADSYRTMSSRPAFQQAMRKFGDLFASPPDITITDVLVEMDRGSIGS